MAKTNYHLIIGGDSVIGRYLNYELLKNNFNVYYTTRRNTKPFTKSIYFDLRDDFNLNLKSSKVYILAGISDLISCENNPVETNAINVDAIINVAKKFYKQGSQILFFSSDMVFGETSSSPTIREKKIPLTEYGRQKSIVEEELLSLGDNVTIFRMTKVVSIHTDFIKNWIENLNKNITIKPYSNYYLSPIS